MPRPLWTGSIAFGLVNIPVRLYSATESHRIAFHEVEEKTGQRIKHKRVAEKSGREVPYDQIVKGFEYSKGKTVVLTDDELRAAEPERDRTITIEQFVALDEIDPISFATTYYVAPDGQAAARAYALLLQTLRDRKLVAIGRFVMRTKEYLVCLRPYQKVMALETLYFADEIRSPKSLPGGGGGTEDGWPAGQRSDRPLGRLGVSRHLSRAGAEAGRAEGQGPRDRGARRGEGQRHQCRRSDGGAESVAERQGPAGQGWQRGQGW
jgi:Ku protein